MAAFSTDTSARSIQGPFSRFYSIFFVMGLRLNILTSELYGFLLKLIIYEICSK